MRFCSAPRAPWARRRVPQGSKPLPHRRHVPCAGPIGGRESLCVQPPDERGHLITTRRRSRGKCRHDSFVERLTCALIAAASAGAFASTVGMGPIGSTAAWEMSLGSVGSVSVEGERPSPPSGFLLASNAIVAVARGPSNAKGAPFRPSLGGSSRAPPSSGVGSASGQPSTPPSSGCASAAVVCKACSIRHSRVIWGAENFW
jgi:hypothetical protein